MPRHLQKDTGHLGQLWMSRPKHFGHSLAGSSAQASEADSSLQAPSNGDMGHEQASFRDLASYPNLLEKQLES